MGTSEAQPGVTVDETARETALMEAIDQYAADCRSEAIWFSGGLLAERDRARRAVVLEAVRAHVEGRPVDQAALFQSFPTRIERGRALGKFEAWYGFGRRNEEWPDNAFEQVAWDAGQADRKLA